MSTQDDRCELCDGYVCDREKHEMRDELLSLRKVADAAARLLDYGDDPGALIAALKDAGR